MVTRVQGRIDHLHGLGTLEGGLGAQVALRRCQARYRIEIDSERSMVESGSLPLAHSI